MDISKKTYELAEQAIDKMSLKKAIKIFVDEGTGSVIDALDNGENITKEDLKNELHEDYAFVLPILLALKVKIEIDEYFCDGCEEYSNMLFVGRELRCPKCGHRNYLI